MSSQEFKNVFYKTFQNISKKHIESEFISYEKFVLLRQYYTYLITWAYHNKNYIYEDSNLLENIKSILKYNHKFVDNVEHWKAVF